MKSFYKILWISLFTLNQIHAQNTFIQSTEGLDIPSQLGGAYGYSTSPSDMYAGRMSYSLPLASLSNYGLQVPVSMSYNSHSKNWYLSAGGSVSRRVIGKPDEEGYLNQNKGTDKIFNTNGSPNYTIYSWTGDNQVRYNYLRDYAADSKGQPDEFIVSAPGLFGRFFLDVDGTPHFTSYTSTKVDVTPFADPNNPQWIFTNASGVKYIFGKYNTRQAIQISYRDYRVDPQDPWIEGTGITNVWSLMAMISPSGEEKIEFFYGENTSNTEGFKTLKNELFSEIIAVLNGGFIYDPEILYVKIRTTSNAINRIEGSSGYKITITGGDKNPSNVKSYYNESLLYEWVLNYSEGIYEDVGGMLTTAYRKHVATVAQINSPEKIKFEYSQHLLNKIVYPLGGYTSFEYEGHDAYDYTPDVFNPAIPGVRIKSVKNYTIPTSAIPLEGGQGQSVTPKPIEEWYYDYTKVENGVRRSSGMLLEPLQYKAEITLPVHDLGIFTGDGDQYAIVNNQINQVLADPSLNTAKSTTFTYQVNETEWATISSEKIGYEQVTIYYGKKKGLTSEQELSLHNREQYGAQGKTEYYFNNPDPNSTDELEAARNFIVYPVVPGLRAPHLYGRMTKMMEYRYEKNLDNLGTSSNNPYKLIKKVENEYEDVLTKQLYGVRLIQTPIYFLHKQSMFVAHPKGNPYVACPQAGEGIRECIYHMPYYQYTEFRTPNNNYFKATRPALTPDGVTSIVIPSFKFRVYNIPCHKTTLKNTKTTVYDDNNFAVENTVNYTYNQYLQPKTVITKQIRNKYIKQEFVYAHELAPTVFGGVVGTVQNRYMLSSLVQTNTYLQENSTEKLMSSAVTTYQLLHNKVLPHKSYQIISENPITDFQNSISNPLLDSRYEQINELKNFDSKGNLLLSENVKAKIPQSTIYGFANNVPIASVTDALDTEIAFTSFEGEGNGGFSNFTYTPVQESITGRFSANVSLSKLGLNSAKTYTVSLWVKSTIGTTGSVVVNGVSKNVAGEITRNGWHLLTWQVSGTTGISIVPSSEVLLDEVRIHPKEALMSTVAYQIGVGKISETNANHITTYYEYDIFNRLKLMRDSFKNIRKFYQYSLQPAN